MSFETFVSMLSCIGTWVGVALAVITIYSHYKK